MWISQKVARLKMFHRVNSQEMKNSATHTSRHGQIRSNTGLDSTCRHGIGKYLYKCACAACCAINYFCSTTVFQLTIFVVINEFPLLLG